MNNVEDAYLVIHSEMHFLSYDLDAFVKRIGHTRAHGITFSLEERKSDHFSQNDPFLFMVEFLKRGMGQRGYRRLRGRTTFE